MQRRWTVGAAVAVVVAIATAISVSSTGAAAPDWTVRAHLSPLTIEVDPAAQTARITLSF